jgi:hypothetical protein
MHVRYSVLSLNESGPSLYQEERTERKKGWRVFQKIVQLKKSLKNQSHPA